MIYSRLSNLPPLVRSFLYVHNGFVVGSFTKFLTDDNITELPKDIDIIVPPSHWNLAMKSIPKGSPTNTFGGIKIKTWNLTCDVWSQDISEYLENLVAYKGKELEGTVILHPKTNTTLSLSNSPQK